MYADDKCSDHEMDKIHTVDVVGEEIHTKQKTPSSRRKQQTPQHLIHSKHVGNDQTPNRRKQETPRRIVTAKKKTVYSDSVSDITETKNFGKVR